MYDRWNVKGFDRAAAVRLCRSGVNPMEAVLLASRGVTDPEGVREYMRDDLGLLRPALELRDMDVAADRVKRAIRERETVAVYGDYDVDGITASCLVADYLRRRGVDCRIYIPERLEEGYGVKSAALDTIKSWGASLVITVDCGITAVEEARYAESISLDMVITDHHECGVELPGAVAAVDPKRPDCGSRFKGLAGVGVAFKLVCAVEGPEGVDELLRRYGDLVATGTIADVMPVTGENRVLIKRGLDMIKRGSRPGLMALMEAAGLEGKSPNVTIVGYNLAPRINAAGRLGRTDTAVELLLTSDPRRAARLASTLCDMNRERQRIEGEMYREALEMLGGGPQDMPIVLASGAWHQGVCGIVASKLSERFNVPAVMICLKDGVGRGSCRSVPGFNLFDALSTVRDMLLSFGGHEMAAGLTLRQEDVDGLRAALGRCYAARGPVRPQRVLDVDLEVVKPELLAIQNVAAMDGLEPYGVGNPQPVLCMRDLTVENLVPLADGRHSKLWLSKSGTVFEAVFFSKRPEELGVAAGDAADAAFCPQINEYRGKRSVQLCLVDLAPAGTR